MSFLLACSLIAVNYSPLHETESIASTLNAYGGARQLSILYNAEDKEWVGQIAEKIAMPVLLNVRQYPDSEIRLVGDPNTLILILDENLSANEVVNSALRCHGTIYLFTTHSLDDVERRLRQFWNCLVISAYALYFNGTHRQLFGFEPTPDGIDVVKRSRLDIVDIFDGHGMHVNTSVVNISPSVILQKRPTDIEGYEGRLMKEVTKKFNLRTQFAWPKDGEWWGWVHPKPTGVIGEVLTEYSAFGIGDIAATATRCEAVDQLPGYSFMECITWAVPKGAGAALPTWVSMLIREYALDAWLGIIFSSIGIVIACGLVDDSGFFRIVFRIFAVSIGVPVNLPLKTSSRILMTVWVWATFVFTIAYQASMGSKLAVPPAKPNIDTFTELLESKLEIFGLYNTIFLMTKEDPLIHALAMRSTHTPLNISTLFDRISKERDIAHMRQISTFRYNAILEPSWFENIHIMDSCAITYQPSIVMSRWSPYFRGTQKMVQWLMESGLIGKWENDLMPQRPSPSKPPSPLDLNHLLGAFAMLFIGYGIAAFVYVAEKFWLLNWKGFFRLAKRKIRDNMR